MSKLCNGSFLVSAWPRKKQILVLHQAEYNDIIIVPSEPIIGQLAVHFKELQLVVSQVRTLPASLSICNKYGSAQELHSTFGHLHYSNHRECSEGFNSKIYPDLHGVNTQTCEQFNSGLRKLSTILAHMKFSNYIKLLEIYIATKNLKVKMKKQL